MITAGQRCWGLSPCLGVDTWRGSHVPAPATVGVARGHYQDREQTNLKGYVLHDSILMVFWKKQCFWDRKDIRGCQGLGWGEALTAKWHGGVFFLFFFSF